MNSSTSTTQFGSLFNENKDDNENSVAKISNHLKSAQEIAYTIGVKNLFYNEQYIELFIADLLGHTYNPNTRGTDAYDENGNMVEYKTINLVSTPRYGSFQFHWLTKDKIDSYSSAKDVYFALRYDLIIYEVWKLPMGVILPDLWERYTKAEVKRLVLNVAAGSNKSKNIDAHIGYSLSTIKKLGAVLVYKEDVESNV